MSALEQVARQHRARRDAENRMVAAQRRGEERARNVERGKRFVRELLAAEPTDGRSAS